MVTLTGFSQVVYEWALGTEMKEICGLTDVMEGSIVRCIVRWRPLWHFDTV
jgi:antiviral helicase SKI2